MANHCVRSISKKEELHRYKIASDLTNHEPNRRCIRPFFFQECPHNQSETRREKKNTWPQSKIQRLIGVRWTSNVGLNYIADWLYRDKFGWRNLQKRVCGCCNVRSNHMSRIWNGFLEFLDFFGDKNRTDLVSVKSESISSLSLALSPTISSGISRKKS